MAQVIRLVRRDQKEIQEWVDSTLIKVEKFLTRLSLASATIAMLCLMNQLYPAAAITCTLCVISLLAYPDRKRIAKFIAIKFRREELLVLSVTTR